jgi:polyisoprenoid-binding protein YceI
MSQSTINTLPVAGTYTVDAVHSSVGFIARHLVASKVRGHFSEFSGSITVGETPETSSVEATVQASSITTMNEMRDGHLKSPDFLDFENHPTLTLKSTSIKAKSASDYELVADLTIRGITKSVSFDLEFLGTGPGMGENVTVAGFEAKTEIDRRDFGVTFEGALENGSLVVSNKIVLEFNIEATLQA